MEDLPLYRVDTNPGDECLKGLRPYQVESIEKLREGIREGRKNQVLCSPTGSGKSICAMHLLKECLDKGDRAVFVAERITLIDQFSEMLDAAGIPHGVHQGNHWRRDPDQALQVASAQTLSRRGFPPCDLLVVDESHVLMTDTLEKIAKRECITIGLTATPFSKGMGKYYDGIVNVTTTNQLTEDGFLVPPKIYAPAEPDMKGVRVVAGEWEEGETSKRATKIVGDVVQEYIKHGNDGKFIAFGVDVKHCEALRSQFLSAGINCALHIYTTPDDERKENMEEFRKPDSYIRGLISVSALSRGLDVPDCSVIIMCRPLKSSFSEFIQVLGRGLRPFPGKDFATVLDLAGNTERFYDRMIDLFANGCHVLDDGKKKEKVTPEKKEPSMAKCPQCSHIHKKMPACPACGFCYPRAKSITHEAGELREIGRDRSTIAHVDRREFYSMMLHHAIRLGYKPGFAAMKFKDKFGSWPTFNPETIDPIPPTPEVAKWLRSQQIRWQYSKRRPA